MKKIKELLEKILTKEVIMYVIFGVLTTMVNLIMFWLLESILKWDENLSNIIAIITSILFAYFTNKTWVFNSQVKGYKENFSEFIRFISGRAVTMIIEFGGCYILFKTSIPPMVSKILISIIIIILNFFISKFFAFKNTGKDEIKNEKN